MITVVVADQSRAQIYSTERLGESLADVESLVNASAHLHEQDLVSDGSGRSMNRSAGVHQSYDPGPRALETARHRFAHDIAASMARHAQLPSCAGIVLVADARLLSEIKQACDSPVLQKLAGEVPKNLSHAVTTELRSRLAELRKELNS